MHKTSKLQVDLHEEIFTDAIPVIKRIEEAGYEAYFVGGCVRDKLLNRPIHDIDIASSARPDEIESLFKRTIDVGKEHGTIIVLHNRVPYEITSFRTEGKYSDYRRPDEVNFVRNLEEDTLRRDFTVNALALDRMGRLYDYHHGLKDLKNHLIRAVGNPFERFQEDALRMMRGVRFSSQLGFEIEQSTLEAIKDLSKLLDKIAIERIQVEMTKYLQGSHFPQNCLLLHETGLINYLPAISPNSQEAFAQLAEGVNPLIEAEIDRDPVLVWALLLYYLDILDQSQQRKTLKKWKHSNKFQNDVLSTIQLLQIYDQNKGWDLDTVYSYPLDLLEMVEEYLKSHSIEVKQSARQIKASLPIHNKSDLAVDGRDVIQILGLGKGTKEVGQILNEIERKVLHNELENDYQVIKEMILQNR